VAGVFVFHRLRWETKILVGYFILIGLVDILALYLAFHRVVNIWLFHLFTPLEYGFLVFVFSCWQRRPAVRLLLRLSIPLFAAVCLVDKLYLEDLCRFDSIATTLEAATLIMISVYTLFDLYREDSGPLLKNLRFWVATAVLIYFSGNFPIFAFANVLTVWSVHHILNITSNMLFTGGFLCCRLR
jgi:hypothetical protein